MTKRHSTSVQPDPSQADPSQADAGRANTRQTLADEWGARVPSTVQAVIDDPIYWFPIRHHSTVAARFLAEVIQQRKPRLVLIEGPAEATELIPILADRTTKPPVAIYSCFQDDDASLAHLAADQQAATPGRWACWYPLVSYSPELVAIRLAERQGARTSFIDLPHAATLAIESVDDRQEATTVDGVPDPSPPLLQQEDRLLTGSDFYQALAEAAGYRTWDEGWDALFEFRDFVDAEDYRREMLTFCAAARASSHADQQHDLLNTCRERFMWQCIHEEIAAASVSPEETLVVCGGYHVFMDRDDQTPPPVIPTGTWYSTVVPYTFFRISSLSGYGAGNRAPAFYQRCWDHGQRQDAAASVMTEYIVAVLRDARQRGEALSAADSISIAQHARMLAALRGRGTPLLDDIHDAIITCCCKGSPTEQGIQLLKSLDSIAIGNEVGRVSKKARRLPLVEDFYRCLDTTGLLEITGHEKRHSLKLDKRETDDIAISQLLHQLAFIDIPFGRQQKAVNEWASGLIFREQWELKWSPDVEAKLIDRNLLGDTVEAAATNHLRTQIISQRGHADEVCALLVEAVQMNLPDLVGTVFASATDSIEEDGRFVSLSHAVGDLARLQRFAEHQELPVDRIEGLFDRAYTRACFAMVDVANAPDEQHRGIVEGLMTLADLAAKTDHEAHADLFASYLLTTLQETQLPYLRGALLGLAVENRLDSANRIVDEINGYAASSQEKMSRAGDLVHGVITVSRASLMTGGTLLVDALDHLLGAAEWDCFVTMLPRLRAAMELLHARHRDSIASRVAEKYGLKESTSLQHLEVSVPAAARMAELDRRVAEIMGQWQFEDS